MVVDGWEVEAGVGFVGKGSKGAMFFQEGGE